jgi:hypothetical protein
MLHKEQGRLSYPITTEVLRVSGQGIETMSNFKNKEGYGKI